MDEWRRGEGVLTVTAWRDPDSDAALRARITYTHAGDVQHTYATSAEAIIDEVRRWLASLIDEPPATG